MNLGTEKTEKIITHLASAVILYKKVAEDKKVDLTDLPHAVEFAKKLPAMIEDFKALPEVLDEVKDLDVTEIVALIGKVDALVKQIEKA